MMPFLLPSSPRDVWDSLERLQQRQSDELLRNRRSPYARGWRPRSPVVTHDPHGRLWCVRMALSQSGDRARHLLTERLAGIHLSMVLHVLINAAEEVALCWGGSVLVGGALGGVLGSLAAGVGAVPGAALGAGMGAQVGAWLLAFLGLKSLIQDLGTAVPEVLRLYEQGLRTAWGQSVDTSTFRRSDMSDDSRIHFAAGDFAQGHVLLMVTLLTALLAYLARGKGDPAARARILQEIRESRRLGPQVAEWVAANEAALARHPGLKPKEQQVVMMAEATPPAGRPMTPSQLRKAAQAEEVPPSPKKSGPGNVAEAGKPPLARREVTAPNGRVVVVATKDGAMVPIDKVAVYARGGSPDVSKELSALQALKQQNRKGFDLDPANQTRLDQLKNMQHNHERSKEMARSLDGIGLPNTPENNDYIMRNLLETARGVTPERRAWVPGTLTGPSGSLRVNSTWSILPDGSKYLTTLRFMPIGG